MITAIDTNILLDILIPNARYAAASQRALEEALAEGALVIGEVVYAELASQFPSPQSLERFLADAQIRLEHAPPQALQKAGAAWKAYMRARGGKLRCPQCGREQQVSCVSCGETIAVRQHILSDFLVGAHAFVCADRLLMGTAMTTKPYIAELHDIGKLADREALEKAGLDLKSIRHTYQKFPFKQHGLTEPSAPSWWGQWSESIKS